MLTLLDVFEIYSMIQRLNSYNLLTEKVTIYRPDKKVEKGIGDSEINFP